MDLLERVEFKFEGIPSSYWIAGFVSGDGSFNIKTTKTRVGKVQLRFAVHLHIREQEVLNYLNSLILNRISIYTLLKLL